MGKIKDLTGQRFGRLVALRQAGRNRQNKILWDCACDCGGSRVVTGIHLTRGDTTSCGCYLREKLTTHGMRGTKIYGVWASMLSRVGNPKVRSYRHYGARGITVCDRWKSFDAFYADMGPTYEEGLTLDRIDTNGNYEPGNCRWATPTEQAVNRRSTVFITYQGHTLALSHWAKQLGISTSVFYNRMKQGWSGERVLAERIDPSHLAAVVTELDHAKRQGEDSK